MATNLPPNDLLLLRAITRSSMVLLVCNRFGQVNPGSSIVEYEDDRPPHPPSSAPKSPFSQPAACLIPQLFTNICSFPSKIRIESRFNSPFPLLGNGPKPRNFGRNSAFPSCATCL